MSSILWRCHRYIDRAVDIQVVRGRWWFPFYEELHVCVPEACNVRIVIAAILKKKKKKKLALMFGIPG